MTADPTGELLAIPAEYGAPSRVLEWPEVRARLEASARYWLATTRPDGRPHTVPTDGIWLDDSFWFGGVPNTVKHRNLTGDGRASVHLPDADAAVIVEGICEVVVPAAAMVERLEQASTQKYGYAPPEGAYASGVWCLRPVKAMAWNDISADATRFRFPA
jgi:hypothetical protein